MTQRSIHPIIQKITATRKEIAERQRSLPGLIAEANKLLPEGLVLSSTEDGTEQKFEFGTWAKCTSNTITFFDANVAYKVIEYIEEDDELIMLDNSNDLERAPASAFTTVNSPDA